MKAELHPESRQYLRVASSTFLKNNLGKSPHHWQRSCALSCLSARVIMITLGEHHLAARLLPQQESQVSSKKVCCRQNNAVKSMRNNGKDINMNAPSVRTGMIHKCLLFVPLSSFVQLVGWLLLGCYFYCVVFFASFNACYRKIFWCQCYSRQEQNDPTMCAVEYSLQ